MTEYVDPETGEVEEIPEGQEPISWLVFQFKLADEQDKIWRSRKGFLGKLLWDHQDQKTAVVDGIKSTKIAGGEYPKQDVAAISGDISMMELNRDDLLCLIRSASGFKLTGRPWLDEVIRQHTARLPRAGHMSVTPVRQVRGV